MNISQKLEDTAVTVNGGSDRYLSSGVHNNPICNVKLLYECRGAHLIFDQMHVSITIEHTVIKSNIGVIY
jgi:hypothetical protein